MEKVVDWTRGTRTQTRTLVRLVSDVRFCPPTLRVRVRVSEWHGMAGFGEEERGWLVCPVEGCAVRQ